jgi:hypothetical protein
MLRLKERMIQWRPAPRTTDSPLIENCAFDALRFGEILAAATIPDFAMLPLELWPGYRRIAQTDNRNEPVSGASCRASAPVNPRD